MSNAEEKADSKQPRWSDYLPAQAILVAAMIVLGGIELHQRGRGSQNSSMPYLGLFEAVGCIAFGTAILHFASQLRLTRRQRVASTIAYVCLYAASYFALSLAGDYHASRSGRYRWKTAGLSVADETIWHAKGVVWQPFVTVDGRSTHQATTLGYFYSPLIYLDRRFWHDSFNMFEDDPDAWLARHPEVR